MARVIALVPDLLFGSQVQGSLRAAGHDVTLAGDETKVRERLAAHGPADGAARDAESGTEGSGTEGGSAASAAKRAIVLVVDLTDDRFDGAAILEALASSDALVGVSTLAFYSHVDAAVRERATQAGFDLVVPRSRMAREGAALIAELADDA